MTPKEIMEALLAGKKLSRGDEPDSNFVSLGSDGQIHHSAGWIYDFHAMADDIHEWEIYEPKLTDEELIAEWEKEAANCLTWSEPKTRAMGEIWSRCARQLRERKL